MNLNKQHSGFDHNLVEELGYESAMPFLEGKFGLEVRKDYNKLILGEDIRITLLHYKDRLEAIYTPYYCPSKLEHRGLEQISYPKVTRGLLDELRDENTTRNRVEEILKFL